MDTIKPLKLQGQDSEDLSIMACFLQGAVGHVGNMVFQPRRRSFYCLLNRLPRERTSNEREVAERIGCILYFRCVLAAHARNLDWGRREDSVSLLTFYFFAREAPGGMARLLFAGGQEICLELEAVEVYLRDVNAPWTGITKLEQARGKGEIPQS